jgi:regulator of sirC expression with transglutaminase-like and TPR domain
MRQPAARALFERLVSVPDGDIDLVRASLAIAAEEDEGLDPEPWAHRIDGLAWRGLEPLGAAATEDERLQRLYALFFDELGFSGEGVDYDDPASSFLHAVVERRRGLPIALAVLFVRIGRLMGLSCAGVSFPGVFLAKITTSEGEIFVDPFHRHRRLTPQSLEGRLAQLNKGQRQLERWMLAAAPPRQILARMLRNLKNLYLRRKDSARAFSAADRILLVDPEAWDDLRDRGLLCAALGGTEAARRDLSRYLEKAPQGADAAAIRARLGSLGSTRTILN